MGSPDSIADLRDLIIAAHDQVSIANERISANAEVATITALRDAQAVLRHLELQISNPNNRPG